MAQNEDIEALVALRLTVLQAKVYLALVNLTEAKMSSLSKEVRVARQDIYRVTDELLKIGLIEKVIASPIRYRAIPMREAVPILLQRIHKERAESQEKAIKLLDRYEEKRERARPIEKAQQFILIPEKEALLRRLSKSTENAQKCIDIVSSWLICAQALFELSSKYQQALKKKTKMRWITDKPEGKQSELNALKVFTENPLFELRYVFEPHIQRLGIFDKKEVYVASFPKSGFVASPALWSNASSLITLSQHYFDTLWNQATKLNITR